MNEEALSPVPLGAVAPKKKMVIVIEICAYCCSVPYSYYTQGAAKRTAAPVTG